MSNLQFTSSAYYFISMLWIIIICWNYSKFVETKFVSILFSLSFQNCDHQIYILWISNSSFITKIFHSIRNFPYLFLRLNPHHYSKPFLSLLLYPIILLFTLFFTFSEIYLRHELWYMYTHMIMDAWKG